MATLLEEQTANFFATTACICAAYVLTTVTICVTYVHRVIGPTIPLRRHIMALADGDYSSRVQLRGSDAAMEELADELNELARQLELNPAKIEN
jgi:signal transduction histidine kinase